MGALKLGTGQVVEQPEVLSSKPGDVFSLLGLAFFLFIGVEFIVPISTQVKNPRKKVPLGMVISLLAILVMQVFVVIGFSHYTPWEELSVSTVPHILYGTLLYGKVGTIWMTVISLLACQHFEYCYVLHCADLFRHGKAETAALCVYAEE